MNETDILESCKELHLASEWDLDEMGWFEEMKMSRNIIPENCTSFLTH